MKTVEGRVRRLEIQFGAGTGKAVVPSVAESIVQMLAAGVEWQCALKLLERGEGDVGREQGPIEHSGRAPKGSIDIGFTDLTPLRQTLCSSLADLAPELRAKIARQLLAADTDS